MADINTALAASKDAIEQLIATGSRVHSCGARASARGTLFVRLNASTIVPGSAIPHRL